MGCVASRINKEERVQVCRERKKLMKQLLIFRGEVADAQLAYLRALKNTGVTLRQFTESESLELENTHYGLAFPPSPPPPLPPSPPSPPPPPPPPFSPDNSQKVVDQEESTEITKADIPSPPDDLTSSWVYRYTFESSSLHCLEQDEMVEPIDEENWLEANTDFDGEQEGEASTYIVAKPPRDKSQPVGLVNDNSSTLSWLTKDTAETAMVLRRSKKTLEGIAKELDDYFLKASAGIKEIAVLMDINGRDRFLPQNLKESKSKYKLYDPLAFMRHCFVLWIVPQNFDLESVWSLQLTKDAAVELDGASEPCRPGAHCITLKKLYDEEQKLYKEVKEEETAKLEHERKSLLLQKQEEENLDWTKTEKTRLSVENLEADISQLQQSISSTSSLILKLIDDELYPQLVALTSGLLHMWRIMHECHQAQYIISQQLNHLRDNQRMDLSTDYRRQAAAQLETELNCWYSSFCKVVKSQGEYVKALCRWIQLTDRLVDEHRRSLYSPAVHSFCEQWQLGLDNLPDKVSSEAIKSLWSAIHSILLQQEEEHNLQRKYGKLEKRLQKEFQSLTEMEKKLEGSFATEDEPSNLNPKHSLSLKRAKFEALKKQVDVEKAKCLNSVQVSNTMTLNNLKASLPNVFHSLMGFCSAYVEAIEGSFRHIKPADSCDGA
ncbi:hypothetical protein FNV43_RR06410 [Rhamnella rubrinervis]|uniref:Nitrate regulatory gene2 protein n=1 Tax=Rhamnella rubrinervis TaxID=2594499 RepID=A0A8K0HEH2_9ROSA|nr:hypothetical protein FNV43_RR06410 [Rhamnella rubrinervis]